MLLRLGISCLFAASAAFLALHLPVPLVFLVWTSLAALLCIVGAALLASQPIGIATMAGQVGASFARWGFRAGRGKLISAVAISWLVWTVLGSAIIEGTLLRSEPKTVLMLLTWTVDLMALFYVLGLILANFIPGGRNPGSLFVIGAALVAIIAGSAGLWAMATTDAAETSALLLGAAPTVIVGAGYGIVLAITVGSRGKTSWH